VAIEARVQRGDKAFFDINRRLFEAQPDLSDQKLLEIAADLRLNEARVKRALAKETHKKVIQADTDIAQDFEARGVPHFFINGVRLSGARPLQEFVDAVERERARALEIVGKGTPRRGVFAALMKDAKAPAPPATKIVALPKDPPARGPAGAPIVIQVFSDFQCPFCKRALSTMEALDKAHPGKIRWVFRHLPLAFDKDAKAAARAAMEARAQQGNKGFWAMHDALFEAQGTPDGLSEAGLLAIAKTQGLDLDRFRAALTSGVHDARIDADLDAAKAASISGTPGFTVNGYFVSGAQPVGVFEKLIRYSRKVPAKAAAARP
jgi:protein-disulfide isomerase